MKQYRQEGGFSLVETMIAAAIAGIAFAGTMGAVETASRFVRQASLAGKAQGTAQSRLEAKRSVRWRLLLEDDLDRDGVPETVMKDDGQGRDAVAGDGIYTAAAERDGITEVWTVEVDRPGPIASVGAAIIRSVVTYDGSNGPQEVRVETIRANPAFVGQPHL
jgi:prepilin-type N-terminal cleavage/methylation domain-containing protein